MKLKADDKPDPWVRFWMLVPLPFVFLALPCVLFWWAFRDQTYIENFAIPGGSIEINSGDGDPMQFYRVTVKLDRGDNLEGPLGFSASASRHMLIGAKNSPFVGVVAKNRPQRVVLVINSSSGEFWAVEDLGHHFSDMETGRKLLARLCEETGQHLDLAESANRDLASRR